MVSKFQMSLARLPTVAPRGYRFDEPQKNRQRVQHVPVSFRAAAPAGGKSGLCQFAGCVTARSRRNQMRYPCLNHWPSCCYGIRGFGVRDALNPANAMLRITLHQDGSQVCLELAGRLYGPWVSETENAWRSVLGSGKEVAVDMREVTGVDDAGRQLLAAMHRAGAHLIVQGLWMTAVVDEITGERPFDGTKRPQRGGSTLGNLLSRNQEK